MVDTTWTNVVGRAYAAHRDRLLGYLGKLGVPGSEREDTLHDAVMYVMRLTRPRRTFIGYGMVDAAKLLNSVCLIMARRYYVKSHRDQNGTLIPVGEKNAEARAAIGTYDENNEAAETVERATRATADLFRCPISNAVRVIALTREGTPRSEIAAALGMRPTSVSRLLQKVRTWMRAAERRGRGENGFIPLSGA